MTSRNGKGGNSLMRDTRFRETAIVAVFEGNDAAGKGGAIRRVTSALVARFYKTVSIAAPTDEERARPYLWRFWRHVPRHGFITIFDRSWYGRVLVERVEGFATEADWMRAYTEIDDFEQELVRNGTIVLKFWLAISKEEQLKRFQLRDFFQAIQDHGRGLAQPKMGRLQAGRVRHDRPDLDFHRAVDDVEANNKLPLG